MFVPKKCFLQGKCNLGQEFGVGNSSPDSMGDKLVLDQCHARANFGFSNDNIHLIKIVQMRISLLLFLLGITSFLFAQDELGYKTPPKEIMDLVLAKPTPGVSIDRKGEWMLLLDRSPLPSVEELAQPELRIAGI